MKEDIIKLLISDFHTTPLPKHRPRDLDVPLNTQKILSITGPRRAGKTAYCQDLIRQMLAQGKTIQQILYINFEDERLDRTTEELDAIITVYRRMYPHISLDSCVFIFDEIQNVPKWDQFVRRVYDTLCKSIIVTGSNSKALGKDIATSLRGRTLTYEILPLSFKEYLQFLDGTATPAASQEIALVQHHLETYLVYGGFPETVFFEPQVKIKTLQDYFEVMMYRDVGERAGIADSQLLRFFLKRSFACATKGYSVNKLFNELKSAGYKLGKNTLYDIADICRQAYLFFTVPKYTQKIANIELGEKNLYSIDAGLLVALGLVMPHEPGKLMEQAVFLELYRRYNGNLFFDSNGYECDFILGEWDDVRAAVQVTQSLEDPDVRQREIKGLVSACKKFGLGKGTIVTKATQDRFTTPEGIVVEVVPLWQWLLAT